MIPADTLTALKDDLGIPPADSSNDAWLNRRWDALLRHAFTSLGRWFGSPERFRDRWRPGCGCSPADPVAYLSHWPVTMLERVAFGPTDQAVADFYTTPSGGLVSTAGHYLGWGPGLNLVVEYQAGFDPMPADIYDAFAASILRAWRARPVQGQPAALAGLVPQSITVADVGAVGYRAPGVGNGGGGGGADADPFFADFEIALEPYRDSRKQGGFENMPWCERLGPPVKAAPGTPAVAAGDGSVFPVEQGPALAEPIPVVPK